MTELLLTVPEGLPKDVTLDNTTYPLHYAMPDAKRYAETWAWVIVEGVPVATVTLCRGVPYRHSKERAAAVVASYLRNNKRTCMLYETAYGMFDIKDVHTPSPEGSYPVEADQYAADMQRIADGELTRSSDNYNTSIPTTDGGTASFMTCVIECYEGNKEVARYIEFSEPLTTPKRGYKKGS